MRTDSSSNIMSSSRAEKPSAYYIVLHCKIIACSHNKNAVPLWQLQICWCMRECKSVGCWQVTEMTDWLTDRQQWIYQHAWSRGFVLRFSTPSGAALTHSYWHTYMYMSRTLRTITVRLWSSCNLAVWMTEPGHTNGMFFLLDYPDNILCLCGQ